MSWCLDGNGIVPCLIVCTIEGFWKSIAGVKFYDPSKAHPLLRSAVVLAALTSPKVEDGVARLIRPVDISKMASKQKAAIAAECESTLYDAARMVGYLTTNLKLKQDAELGPLGRLWVRVALLATDKGKFGREKKDFTIGEIRSMFLADLCRTVGSPVEYPKWECDQTSVDVEASDAASSQQPHTKKARVATTSDHDDPTWILDQKGFHESSIVVQASQNTYDLVYKIVSIGSDISLELVCDFGKPDKLKEITIPLQKFLMEWTQFKGHPPCVLRSGELRSPGLSKDLVKAKLYQAILSIDERNRSDHLRFFCRPNLAITTKKLGKGELLLCPIAPLQNITTKKSPGAVPLGEYMCDEGRVEFFMVGLPKVKVDNSQENMTVAAFWWAVASDKDKGEPNLSWSISYVDGFHIPVLGNKAPLPEHAVLVAEKMVAEKMTLPPAPKAKAKGKAKAT